MLLSDAIKYCEMGLSVVPGYGIIDGRCSCGDRQCNSPGKHPRLRWKSNIQTKLEKAELNSWWKRYPESNIIIVTGSISGIAVLDIDGEEGLESLRATGLDLKDLPLTPLVKSGGGGWHLYFKYPEGSSIATKAGVLHKVDIRAEGGVIVAPPSHHLSGRDYEWMKGRSIHEINPAIFDFTLLTGKQSERPQRPDPSVGLTWYEAFLEGVGQGERNSAASRLAGRYLGMGMTLHEVTLLLSGWNMTNDPPLSLKEIETVVGSISKKESEIQQTDPSALLTRLSDILQIKIVRIDRITGDSPQIIMEFDQGSCKMTTAQLLSPPMFQKAVAEATKRVVRKLSVKTSPTHDRFAEMVLRASTDVSAGVEATELGETMAVVRDLLTSTTIPQIAENDDAPDSGCFRASGSIWLSLADVMQRGSLRWGIKTSPREMAQRLRGIGAKPKNFNTSLGERSVWGLSESLLPVKLGRAAR